MKERLRRFGKSVKQSSSRGINWAWTYKFRVAVLALVFTLMAPRPARSQFLDPCCAILEAGLSTVASTLSGVVGGGLNSILSVDRTIQNFEQTVVWPAQLIAEAKALVGNIQGLFTQMQNVTNLPVASATLPTTQQFESNLLSANANQVAGTSQDYTAVYGPVPNQTSAPPVIRNEIDMSDAVAEDAMKRAIEIDNLANLELQAASQINQSIQTAAPGSAPIIEAQADAWLVRANAYTQAALADLMRVRAVGLANAGADLKLGATNAVGLEQEIQQMLNPR
jgi:hypothetical protein